LLEFDIGKERPYRFVLDFGSDLRHSLLYSTGLKIHELDAFFLSHNHSDHQGSCECIALSTFFNPYWRSWKKDWLEKITPGRLAVADACLKEELPDDCKPELFGHKEVLKDLWTATSPGLNTIQGMMKVNLSTYFTIRSMTTNIAKTIQDGKRTWKFYTIESTHVMSGMGSMPSYGLMFESSDGKCIYFPTDTMFMMPPTMKIFYDKADIIYQDTETGPKSGVHSHWTEVDQAPEDIKKKLYLYHYNEEPPIDESQYKGILRTGDIHEW
jgi:ribonuclease BN (tRNA processing enzyme)